MVEDMRYAENQEAVPKKRGTSDTMLRILHTTFHIIRGCYAPESSIPYGKEAKKELVKLVGGKCLRVLVYGEDRYGRCVRDIYCNGKFVQEIMLKKGLAWHYSAYDQRIELATWERRLEQSGSVYGLYRILRSHGNGERTNDKADDVV
ncbi:hypothetical protein GOBAR_AA08685 [Gossypium barbadense]|uniref:TNase-like domain-containing protein n=1 Tax=Gossypium barbadense TaxID=3634 RepID=A0A2P5Y8K3_GOSBA|nr:hypothetical protein GOBAR_AA08685 [Gossypium barbadense]